MPRNVAVGVGLMEFPFSGVASVLALGRSVRAGGVDSIWQTDRLVSPSAVSRMHERAGGARRAHQADQVRRQRAVAGDARRGAGGAAMRDDRFSVERAPAAGLRHRQPARAGMDRAQPRPEDPRAQDRRGAGGHPPVVVAGQGRFRRRALQAARRLDRAKAGAARSADVDRRLVRGGDPAHRADRHGLAGRAGDPGAGQGGRRRDQAGRRRSGPHDRRRPLRRRHSRTASARRTTRRSRRCSRPTGSAPAAIPGIISRSAMPTRSSRRSPITSRRACRNSSCARRPGATTRSWRRPAV